VHAGATVPACDPPQTVTTWEVATIASVEHRIEPEGGASEALGWSVFATALDNGHQMVREPRMTSFGELEIPEHEARWLSDEAVARRLVATGVSRLTAARVVEITRGKDEPGRARPHYRAAR
jgi:hypothetical protein